MTYYFRALCGASLVVFASTTAMAQTQDPNHTLTDVIIVTAPRSDPDVSISAQPNDGKATAPDAASLVAKLPGAALIGNGPISGQVQYRGLFSDRLLVRINDQKFQSGGPNAMDPPLHYAPMILIDRIEMSRGTGPVSDGPGLGGSVNAQMKYVDFADGDTLRPHASTAATYRAADQGYAIGGVVGASNQHWRFNVLGAYEQGDDYRIGGGGKARDTGYQRISYGVSGGYRSAGNSLSLEWRRQETRPSGNPPYAMDIEHFHTDFLRAGFAGDLGFATLKADLGYARVTHGMDNFSLRPAPADRSKWRYSSADADTITAGLSLQRQGLRIGLDAEQIDRSVTINNPNNAAFWITSLNRVDQHRLGVFAEYTKELGRYRAEIGGRLDWSASRIANPRVGGAVPPMIAMLAGQVANRNQALSDTSWDAVARLWADQGTLRPRLTLAHKQRVPNAVERHSWLPTEASGGLADGNIYIGNMALKPERAWIAEAGIDIVTGRARVRPSLFYRRIDHYVQGTPVPTSMTAERMIAGMNGDATPLIFSNVDAALYGADMDLRWALNDALRVDATLSYVRGKRRDVADNLYRIAPLNGRASLTWDNGYWSLTAEAAAAAEQTHVSRTNDEQPSKGWVIANLWGDWRVGKALRLSGGVENIFDRRYANHLSGVNRVSLSDVAIGEKLPATGRSLFVRVGFDY